MTKFYLNVHNYVLIHFLALYIQCYMLLVAPWGFSCSAFPALLYFNVNSMICPFSILGILCFEWLSFKSIAANLLIIPDILLLVTCVSIGGLSLTTWSSSLFSSILWFYGVDWLFVFLTLILDLLSLSL